jgi:HSP20 family protein
MSEESRDIQVQEVEKRQVAESEAERTRERPAFVPRADIYETDNEIVVLADMPGVDESSVDITLENNVLTINGYVPSESPEGYDLAYAEYQTGDYQRSFSLSNEIDQDQVEASMKDGVLRLRLPKITEARTRRIAVKTG